MVLLGVADEVVVHLQTAADGLLLCQFLGSTGDKSSCKLGIIRIHILRR